MERTSPEDRIDRAVRRDRVVQLGLAAGGVALAFARPAALPPMGRAGYRAAVAALAGVGTWSALTRWPAADANLLIGGTSGVVGAALGVIGPAERLDEAWHRRLERSGVPAPRLVLAAATALAFGAATLLDVMTTGRPAAAEDAEDDSPEPLIDVPQEVRALAEALLARTASFGGPELRDQLRQARAVRFEGPEPAGFWPGIGFAVPGDLPLAVPGNGVLPVVGRFRALDDRTFDVSLSVQDGRLAVLSIGPGADWTEEQVERWIRADRNVDELDGWPDPADLVLLIETPTGYAPA